jgi:hypothetical protein
MHSSKNHAMPCTIMRTLFPNSEFKEMFQTYLPLLPMRTHGTRHGRLSSVLLFPFSATFRCPSLLLRTFETALE